MQPRLKIDTPLLNYTQTNKIAKTTGVFERQYICLATGKRAPNLHQLWREFQSDLLVMRKSGQITLQQRMDLADVGRAVLIEHAQVLAHELSRYGLLDEYLKKDQDF